MIAIQDESFAHIFGQLQHLLLDVEPVHVGEWQSKKLEDNPSMTYMRELLHVTLEWPMPDIKEVLAEATGAHLPWAEDHFQERVSGQPMNPPPSNEWWPFAQQANLDHKSDGTIFSHTYPERFWPKLAGELIEYDDIVGQDGAILAHVPTRQNWGIRYPYGDLQDVVNLLRASPNTRQAFLPVWFPEDTGSVHGERVPCTLGYHFMIRDKQLHIDYLIRSCDLIRHFQDDVYMAVRLAQWVLAEINHDGENRKLREPYVLGNFHMNIGNLHTFNGDTAMMKYRDGRGSAWNV